MKVTEPQNKQINERLQQVYSAVNSQQVSGENELSSQLMEEFARILDKIAATVADIKKSNAASDLVVSDEFFADLNQVTEFHFKPEQSLNKSDNKENEQNKEKQEDLDLEAAVQNNNSNNNTEVDKEDKEVKADTIKDDSVEAKTVSQENDKAKDDTAKDDTQISEDESDKNVDTVVVSSYAQTQIKANNIDKELKLVEKSDQQNNVTEQNIEGQVNAQSEASKDSLDFTKQELNKIAAKLGKQFNSDSNAINNAKPNVQNAVLTEVPQASQIQVGNLSADQVNEQATQRLIEKLAEKLNLLPKQELQKIEALLHQPIQIQLASNVKAELTPSNIINSLYNGLKQGQEVNLANVIKSVQPTALPLATNLKATNNTVNQSEKFEEPHRLPRGVSLRTLHKVEDALKEVAKSKDGKTISVRLDPPNLGQVKVDVSFRDGILSARLQADNPQVTSLLREHGLDLQNVLRKLGFSADDIQVTVKSDAGSDSEFSNLTDSNQAKQNKKQQAQKDESQNDELVPKFNLEEKKKVSIDDHWVA